FVRRAPTNAVGGADKGEDCFGRLAVGRDIEDVDCPVMQNDVGVSVMPRAVDRRLDEGIGRTWKRHPIDAVVTDTNDRILETIFCKWIRSTTHPVCVTKEAIGHMHDVGVYSLPA